MTSIGDWKFRDYKSLTSIMLPNSVTSIGMGAFCSEEENGVGAFEKFGGKGKANAASNPQSASQKSGELVQGPCPQSESGDNSSSGSRKILELMVTMAEAEMDNGCYEEAAQTYREILKLESNVTAQYNLGSFYAQGLGVTQSFLEGGYWFRQAELSGDDQARKPCIKCMMDFIFQRFEEKSAEQLYFDMMRFIYYVYPEEKSKALQACRKLYALAEHRMNQQRYAEAAKLFRAAAEFGQDGYAQSELAVLYHAGAGLEKNELAALYWLDKAVDCGAADLAQADRDGLLDAYRTSFAAPEFYGEMMKLVGWCSVGSTDVPKDAAKAIYWREMGEGMVRELEK